MKKSIVNILDVDPSVDLEIIYATRANFTGQVVYSKPLCFLRPKVALKIKSVQEMLKKEGLGLKIYDGYRPHSVQKLFFKLFPDPNFIADPAIGSNHNRAAAVDVTLIDFVTKKELEMPTKVDSFQANAHSYYPYVSIQALKNRALLQYYMVLGGFEILEKEWWHFNCKEAKEYEILDVSFDDLSL